MQLNEDWICVSAIYRQQACLWGWVGCSMEKKLASTLFRPSFGPNSHLPRKETEPEDTTLTPYMQAWLEIKNTVLPLQLHHRRPFWFEHAQTLNDTNYSRSWAASTVIPPCRSMTLYAAVQKSARCALDAVFPCVLWLIVLYFTNKSQQLTKIDAARCAKTQCSDVQRNIWTTGILIVTLLRGLCNRNTYETLHQIALPASNPTTQSAPA